MEPDQVIYKQLLIFLNNDLKQKCILRVYPNISLMDVVNEAKLQLQIDDHVKCSLYDSNGGEVEEDDVEYLNCQEPLFLSQGEPFSKKASLSVYKEKRELGRGGFGLVKLCKNILTKQYVAIKYTNCNSLTSPEEINRVYSEIATLRNLRHPNIVGLIDAFPVKNSICFVMEYCSGGELGDYIRNNYPIMESDIYSIAIQICEAIRYCHSAKIIHRDLKPENVLLANKFSLQIKVVDFGIAGLFAVGGQGEKLSTGSLPYTTPEMLRGDTRVSPVLDIWGIGCIIYILLTGERPFKGQSANEMIQNITNITYDPLPDTVSPPWSRLLRGIFRKNPKRRWDLLRITEYLYKHRERPQVSSNESSLDEEEKAPSKSRSSRFSPSRIQPNSEAKGRRSLNASKIRRSSIGEQKQGPRHRRKVSIFF